MTVRVSLFGHRAWVKNIYEALVRDDTLQDFVVFTSANTIAADARYADLGIEDLSSLGVLTRKVDPNDTASLQSLLKQESPDFVLFYGWSWILPDALTQQFRCVCLHPSLLPKYRGGTPLQHQIINGEKEGGISLFIMDKGIDDGEVIKQAAMDLSGDLTDIFSRMTPLGITLTKEFLTEYEQGLFVSHKQDEKAATLYKRRKLEDSELTAVELAEKNSVYIHDKIRALQDPYPNAYIVFTDATIKLKHSIIVDSPYKNAVFVTSTSLNKPVPPDINTRGLYLQTTDGFVHIDSFTLE